MNNHLKSVIYAAILIGGIACTAPHYKQLVGVWNIDEYHITIRNNNGQLMKDTVMKNCGRFEFYKVDDGKRKDNKGKIRGYVIKPEWIRVNNTYFFVPGHAWFEGTAREPQIIDDKIEFWFSGLTPYQVTKKEGNTIHCEVAHGNSETEKFILTKQ